MDEYTKQLKKIIAIKQQNLKLMDTLISSLQWVIHYTEKNNIPFPDVDGLHHLLKESIKLMENSYLTSSHKNDHSDSDTQNGTLDNPTECL